MLLKGLFNYAHFVYCFQLLILHLFINAHYTCIFFIYPCFLYCSIPYNTGCNSSIEMYCVLLKCSLLYPEMGLIIENKTRYSLSK